MKNDPFEDEAFRWQMAQQASDDALMAPLRTGIAPPTPEELRSAIDEVLRDDEPDDELYLDADERAEWKERREIAELERRIDADEARSRGR